MANRFTETDKWQDRWFRGLMPADKLAWLYICDTCDQSGVFELDEDLADFCIGIHCNWEAFLQLCGKRVERLSSGRFWIVRFVEFQQKATVLKTRFGYHKKIIGLFEKHGINFREFGYSVDVSPCATTKPPNPSGTLPEPTPKCPSKSNSNSHSKSKNVSSKGQRSVARPSSFEFPVKGNPKTWTLSQDKLDEWRETYQGLDVESELNKARQWTRDNAEKRKTANGMIRFLSNWLARVNDRGNFEAATHDPYAELKARQKADRERLEKQERLAAAERSRAEAAAHKPKRQARGELRDARDVFGRHSR